MKTLNQVLADQVEDIKEMLTKLEMQPKSEKQKEEAYKVLQSIQNKLGKLIK